MKAAATRKNMEAWYAKFLDVLERCKGNPNLTAVLSVSANDEENFTYSLHLHVWEKNEIKHEHKHKKLLTADVSTWYGGALWEDDRQEWAKIKRIAYGR